MEVDFAILADAAEVQNGKLYVLGGAFDTIWATNVPVVHAKLSFIMRILFTPAELDRSHNIEVNIIDEDGKAVAKIGGSVNLGGKGTNLPPGRKHGMLSVLNFGSLKFDKFGYYSFEILINNTSLKSVPLQIAQRVAMSV